MLLLALFLVCAEASGLACTVADCSSFQKELLKRVLELDWSGSAGAAALDAEAQFQSRAIVPIDWLPVFDGSTTDPRSL